MSHGDPSTATGAKGITRTEGRQPRDGQPERDPDRRAPNSATGSAVANKRMIAFFLAISGQYTGDVRQVTALALPEDAVPELGHRGWVAEGVVD